MLQPPPCQPLIYTAPEISYTAPMPNTQSVSIVIPVYNEEHNLPVLFDEIAQERWGRQGTAFDPTSLYEVLFQISATAKFGLWIDDVVFLRPPVLY